MGKLSVATVEVPRPFCSWFVNQVRSKGIVRYVEPNLRLRLNLVPNDPNWSVQWAPKKIRAEYAWNTTLGDQKTLVSVVDTGIDYNHEDLSQNYNASGYNWVENNTDPMDPPIGKDYEGHGTFCSGIIAAEINNGKGVAGLAQVQIMAERTDFYLDELANAIKHSADVGAKIISCSFGDFFDSNILRDAIKYAFDKGVLIIAGAGNEASTSRFYPAAYNEVISVSGTTESDQKASFSNFGDWIEVAAPAVNIFSTTLNNSYRYWGGTSAAGPHVVGVAALIWSRYPNLTRDQVRVQLRYTADDLGPSGFDNIYGYGRINAEKAVETPLPDSDLTVLYWNPPLKRIDPYQNVTIEAAIHNFGLNDAYNVSSALLANDTVIDEVTLPFLASGETTIANFSWIPTQEGSYNVTCSLLPIEGESILVDNVRQINVQVSYRKTIEVPSDYPTISAALAVSNDGDLISVSSGIYDEQIVVDKSVSIVGSGRNSTFVSDAIVVEAPSVRISGFTICNGSDGVFIQKTAQNTTVVDCMIYNCSSWGIRVCWTFGIRILNNVIRNVTIGLGLVDNFQYSEVIANNFTGNTLAIHDTADWSRGNLFVFNNFEENSDNVYSISKTNIWDKGYPLGGNYWDDFNGTDTYRGQYQNVTGMDGIGDTPYEMQGTNGTVKDRYPLMHPWSEPRNHGFEHRSWSVYFEESWNASSGWRDRRGDIDGNGAVNILDVTLITSIYGSRLGDPNWNPKCDLDGDGVVGILDLTIVTSEYGSVATRLSGVYSWFSNGSTSSNFTIWQQLDFIDNLRNRTIHFTFSFYPKATDQAATAMIYYATPTCQQWIIGNEKNGMANQWNQASVYALIPQEAICIQIWIKGQPNFKAYLDDAMLTVEY